MLTTLGKRIDVKNEHVNKELENMKTQSEMKTSVVEIKNTLEVMKSRLNDTEECISDPEGRIMEIICSEQQKEKLILRN